MSLLAIFCVLKRVHSELDTEALIALKDQSRNLNDKDPCINIEMDGKAHEMCQSETHMKILTTR